MGKIIKPLAVVAAIAVNFIPGVGQVLSATLISAITTAGVGAALSLASSAMMKTPKASQAQDGRLYATIDPDTPRKMVFGRTAMATDIRYQEYTGADQEYLHMIVCVASHRVEAIEELWLEDKLVWTAGGVAASHAGYLTVTPVLEGSAANTVAISANWGASRRLTGCAYLHLRFKLTGNSKKAESPFAGGVPNRMTVVGKGALLYDPRRDSSVGGSGTMRADNQATWAWAPGGVEIGRNPPLEELWYLLGWRINGKLAVGRGTPPARINMASFITAANACDEAVAKAAGGTEPRYRADGVFSESDAPGLVFENLTAACNGVLRDVGGRLGLTVIANDLGAPIASFTADHILGGFNWDQTPSLEESFNIVRGRYTDPSPNALYQPVDYPAVKMAAVDGLDRPRSVDLLMVQSPSQAQRLVKQALQRSLYQGTFTADFNAAGWRVQLGDVVRLSFPALGFFNKLFRVIEHTIKPDGVCPMTLREENAAIYAWDAEEAPAVIAAAPITYDPLNDPLIAAALLTDGATKNRLFRQVPDPADSPANEIVNGDIWTDISAAPIVSKIRIGGSWQTSANYVTNTNQIADGAGLGTTANITGIQKTGGGAYTVEEIETAKGTALNTTKVGSTLAATVETAAFRATVGLDSSGNVSRPILSAVRESSDILGRAGGGFFNGELNATFGAVGGAAGNFMRPGGGAYAIEEFQNVSLEVAADGTIPRSGSPARKLANDQVGVVSGKFVNPGAAGNGDYVGNSRLRTATSGGVFYLTTLDEAGASLSVDSEDLNLAGLRADGVAPTAGRQWAAEVGANRTETRVSADTAAVAGTVAATVASGAARGVQGLLPDGSLVAGKNTLDAIGDSPAYVRSTSAERAKLAGTEAGATRDRPERAINRNSSFSEFADGAPLGWIHGIQGRTGSISLLTNFADSTRGGAVLVMNSFNYIRGEQLVCSPGETLWLDYRFLTTVNRADGTAPTWYLGLEWATTLGGAVLSGTYPTYADLRVSVANGPQVGLASFVVPAGMRAVNVGVTLDIGVPNAGAVGVADYLEVHRDEPGANVTENRPIVSRLNPATGQGLDSRLLNASNSYGIRALSSAPVVTDTDNGGSVTVNVSNWSLFPDWGAELIIPPGNLPGAAYGSTIFIWRNMADPGTTGTSWDFSTNPRAALGAGKAYIGFPFTTRAAAGAPPPPPPPPPPPGRTVDEFYQIP